MAEFFIDTSTGRVATHRQLAEAGISDGIAPPAPWHRMQGPGDASTMWYAVLRKETRGVFIGRVVLRHGGQYASLLGRGWTEVAPAEVGAEA
ncbi:MAG TPA: hypothetical protein VK279_15450 [Solirubrobacteraceae bacterium]|nr:hypothetical protein [Solirubrobacteraceae bacterium]